MRYPEYQISVLATNSPYFKGKRFSAKPVYPKLRTPFNKLNSLIKNLKVNQYFSFFSIIREIKRFKPDIIIVQRDLTFSAMLAGLLKKIPVINFIRDGMSLCPICRSHCPHRKGAIHLNGRIYKASVAFPRITSNARSIR